MKNALWFAAFMATCAACGCSMKTIHRDPPVAAQPETPYARASRLMDEAAFGEAAVAWERHLATDPTSPRRGPALFNLALCYLHLDQPRRSLEKIRSLLEDACYLPERPLQFKARLLESEAYLRAGSLKEALAATFELLPADKSERNAGFPVSRSEDFRNHWAGKLTRSEQAQVKALRGRILGGLGKIHLAETSLGEAAALLDSPKDQDSAVLRAQISMYQLEIIEISCKTAVPIPPLLSEAEALGYIDAYYRCAAPARRHYCDTVAARDAAIGTRALRAYKGLATFPLKLAENLPPPARPLKNAKEKTFHERELKEAIRSWSEEKIKVFKHLDFCGIENIF